MLTQRILERRNPVRERQAMLALVLDIFRRIPDVLCDSMVRLRRILVKHLRRG